MYIVNVKHYVKNIINVKHENMTSKTFKLCNWHLLFVKKQLHNIVNGAYTFNGTFGNQ